MDGPEASVVALLIVFIVAAVVVSFDVAGLTLSKGQYFAERPIVAQRRWAYLNASWHSGLLLAYGAIIHFGLDFVDFRLLDWIKDAFTDAMAFLSSLDLQIPIPLDHFTRIIELLREHVRILMGAVTLVIVWVIYDNKIANVVHRGSPRQLGGLPRSAYSLLVLWTRLWGWFDKRPLDDERVTETRERLVEHLQAALVAVDMLALAALLKALNYLDSGWMIFSITVIVFIVVLTTASVCARFACRVAKGNTSRFTAPSVPGPSVCAGDAVLQQPVSQDQNDAQSSLELQRWLIITMRFIEPMLIFYFALELVAWVVFRDRIHSVGFFFGALALVVALGVKHKWRVIVSKAVASPESAPGEQRDDTEKIDQELHEISLLTMIGPLLRIILVVSVGLSALSILLTIVAAASFPLDAKEVLSLDGLVTRLARFGVQCVATASLLAFMLRHATWLEEEWPWIQRIVRPVVHGCERIEKFAFRALYGCMRMKGTLLWCIVALLVAALVPIYEQVAERALHALDTSMADGGGGFDLRSNHYHGLQIAAWLAMAAGFAWLLALVNRRNEMVNSVAVAMEAEDKNEKAKALGEEAPELEADGGFSFATKRFAIVEVGCVLLLFGLPLLAQLHDRWELAGFRVARIEDTVRSLDVYRAAIAELPIWQLVAANERIHYIEAALMHKEVRKRVPRSCRGLGVPTDAWGRELVIQADALHDSLIISIRSAGADEAGRQDDLVMNLVMWLPEAEGQGH